MSPEQGWVLPTQFSGFHGLITDGAPQTHQECTLVIFWHFSIQYSWQLQLKVTMSNTVSGQSLLATKTNSIDLEKDSPGNDKQILTFSLENQFPKCCL